MAVGQYCPSVFKGVLGSSLYRAFDPSDQTLAGGFGRRSALLWSFGLSLWWEVRLDQQQLGMVFLRPNRFFNHQISKEEDHENVRGWVRVKSGQNTLELRPVQLDRTTHPKNFWILPAATQLLGENQFCVGLMAYPLYEGALENCAGVFCESEAFAYEEEQLATWFCQTKWFCWSCLDLMGFFGILLDFCFCILWSF